MLGPVLMQAAAFRCTVTYGMNIYNLLQSDLHSPWQKARSVCGPITHRKAAELRSLHT